jgi:hypothetical protein
MLAHAGHALPRGTESGPPAAWSLRSALRSDAFGRLVTGAVRSRDKALVRAHEETCCEIVMAMTMSYMLITML